MFTDYSTLSPTEVRLRVLANGYDVIPLRGKRPDMEKEWHWLEIGHASPEFVADWARDFPDAEGSGILCCNTPFLDLDIMDQDAVEALEAEVASRFPAGRFMVRIGQPPKRAIPFRTNSPFKKILVELVAPNGKEHRIEFLCDGHQCASFGPHPITKLPYSWHGGSPLEVTASELPLIGGGEAADDLVKALADILIKGFGYRLKKTREQKKAEREWTGNGGADWIDYFKNLINHDNDVALAMAMLYTGMSDGAAVNMGRGLLECFAPNTDPDRKLRRILGWPSAVSSARAKIGEPPRPSEDRLPFVAVSPVIWQDKPVPERQWAVPEWIPRGYVTGLYGLGGEGKTTLSQQLLTSCAILHPFLRLPVTQMRCMGLFCEDTEEDLHIRQALINQHYHCEMRDLENMKVLPRLGHDNMLMTFDRGKGHLTGAWEEIRDIAKSFDAELLIIDTVPDTFAGSEIDRAQARQYVQVALGGLAREIGGTVLATAHPSLSGIASGSGSSGSTGWDAAFRSRIYLHSPKAEAGEQIDPNARELLRVKANYARRHDTLNLVWEKGVFINTKPASYVPERAAATAVFLTLLRRLNREGRAVSHHSRTSNYAPRVFSQRPEREAYKQPDFSKAMELLFAENKIRIEEYRDLHRNKQERLVPTSSEDE
jgi:RecA-family ATPase